MDSRICFYRMDNHGVFDYIHVVLFSLVVETFFFVGKFIVLSNFFKNVESLEIVGVEFVHDDKSYMLRLPVWGVDGHVQNKFHDSISKNQVMKVC